MQFLLIAVNARYIHSNPAIYSLRAYVEEKLRPHVELAEYTIGSRMEDILEDIVQRQPDVIGFSCYIWNFRLIRELVREIPKVLPGTDLWLGGPEVSYCGAEFLGQFPMVQGIMAGEGEETFQALLSYYVSGRKEEKGSLQEIEGLILREGATGSRAPADMDRIPFFYQQEDLERFQNRILYYETSRGCPYRCSYCLSSIDKTMRFRSFERVKEELQFFLDHRVAQVKLIDRTFNCSHSHAMEIWQYIKEHDNGVTNFHFEVAADLMNEEQLLLLSKMRPGLVQLEIGVQTTHEATLKAICRNGNTAHIGEVVKRLRGGRNIHIHLDLIAGLPWEGYERFGQSFREVYAMKPQQLQLGFLKVLRGTQIWEKAGEYGIVYQEEPPYEVLSTKWISYQEIRKLKRIEEMVELYYNSNQFTHTLPVLEKEFADAFAMFEQLAAFYRKKGYFVNTPARSRRYQVLLSFALHYAPEKEMLYRELLTFDYYLREKAKSRPDFCADLTPYRNEIVAFYQKEEETPNLLKDYQTYHAKEMMKMTHMDVFFYPVWEKEAEKAMVKRAQPGFVLFDYRRRNALTGEADAKRI